MSEDRLVIHRSHSRDEWLVTRRGEFARFVAAFPTLAEAEAFVIEHQEPKR